MKIFRKLFLILALFVVTNSFAQTLPEPMKPARLVNDFSGLMTGEQVGILEQVLRDLNTETSTQIVVVTVDDLQGMSPSDYSTELAHKWGIGQKGKDNGILMLVKPKNKSGKGKIFIAVGYGLEGVVPDITAKRIVNNEIIPFFKRGKMFEGIYSGVNTLKGLVANEYTADEYNEGSFVGNSVGVLFILLFLLFLGGGLSSLFRRSEKIDGKGSTITSPAMLPFIFFGGSSGRSSGFDSFSSGSGSFGGFGGGGFGGGGAGGSW